ncbi:GDP-mannose 4,6-dehydratase [Patescibacteria group bacterium]|nr:GDP-mannose 4,6-dehydratase [Patescibacteria group bacterium]
MRNSFSQETTQHFAGKKVLVTGGAGFIGSHLVETLLSFGAEVTVADNFLTGSRQNLAGLSSQLIEANINQPTTNYLPSDYIPDVIFHLASPASPPKYQAAPIETYLANSIGTHYLLQFLKEKNPAAQFLFASTSEVYGDPKEHPQAETYWGNVNPNGLRSCYDEAKRLGETVCGVHAREFGMDVRIIRIFNTYGPRMDLNDGRVIPDFIQCGLQGQPFKIYGDGKQTRSYCYVDDLVAGVLLMVATPAARAETVNLGNPGELTILETAQTVHKVFAALAGQPETTLEESKLEFRSLPSDDPTRRRPDISKAKQLLGWEPVVPFEEGLKYTIASFQKK